MALSLATSLTMLLSLSFGIKSVYSTPSLDLRVLAVIAFISIIYFAYSKWKKKAPSPILLIVISGVLGVILYGV